MLLYVAAGVLRLDSHGYGSVLQKIYMTNKISPLGKYLPFYLLLIFFSNLSSANDKAFCITGKVFRCFISTLSLFRLDYNLFYQIFLTLCI